MRVLLSIALAVLATACDSQAPGGTLGLPTTRGTAAPTAAPRTAPGTSTSPGTSASPGTSGSPGASASPTASASPSGSPTPAKILSANGTQSLLTIRYSAPMRAATSCGTVGQPSALEGAIDRASAYASSDEAMRESIRSAMSATLNADCTAVTFVFAVAAPSGTFNISATGVTDRSGASLDPAATGVTVSVADEGRPRVAGVSTQGAHLVVQFNEPMRELGEAGGVLQIANYRLDGAALDATAISCTDLGCRSVAITLRAGTLVVGRSYQLRVANVVDRAGLNLSPDPTTFTFVARA